MTNRNPCSYLSSTDNKKIHTGGRSLLCPHRYRTVIQIDRISPEVSLSKICIFAPCNCCTFCQTCCLSYGVQRRFQFLHILATAPPCNIAKGIIRGIYAKMLAYRIGNASTSFVFLAFAGASIKSSRLISLL